MKRMTALLLAAMLMLSLTACGGNANPESSAPSEDGSSTTSTTTGDTTTTTTAETTIKTDTTSRPISTTIVPTTVTTSRTKNVQGGQVVTTTTTATTADKSKGKAIKILAVGNSFSVDAMQNHLFAILESAGYTDITLGNLYIGGCSLNTHYNNLENNTAAYEYYKNTDGEWRRYANASASKAFGEAKWDYVTIQQVSSDSGRPAEFKNLQATVDILRQKEPQAKILWHMTWAYQQNSDHWAFAYYNKDQMQMYNAIVSTIREAVLPVKGISDIIPAGTAIQNLRSGSLGDTLTADGYHLQDTYGDYTAALTWFCQITGEKTDAVTYRPGGVADHWDEIVAAVEGAIASPQTVTSLK